MSYKDFKRNSCSENQDEQKNKKVLGIIAEYNPFHKGHLYHLKESIRCTSAHFAVCVMSGNFVQRGEPAIINKWARAKMALLSGVDLVLELPMIYATASAEFFAQCGINILDSLGVVDYVSFGSEIGKIEHLSILASILMSEPASYRSALKTYLDSGLSYPAAVENALKEYIRKTPNVCDDNNFLQSKNISDIVGSSNNILGIEYLKAIKKNRSNIIPITIPRKTNLYNTNYLTGTISSATAIRHYIEKTFDKRQKEQKTQQQIRQELNYKIPYALHRDINETLPPGVLEILEKEFSEGRGPVFFNHFGDIILSTIRKMTYDELTKFPNISEGLENRIKRAANESKTLEQLIESICTKRYTRTRVQRILLNILLNVTSSKFKNFNNHKGPQYIRVLGFNKKGASLLSKINRTSTLPVILKTSGFTNTSNPLLNEMLELEALSTDIYVLGYNNTEYKNARQDFTSSPVIC